MIIEKVRVETTRLRIEPVGDCRLEDIVQLLNDGCVVDIDPEAPYRQTPVSGLVPRRALIRKDSDGYGDAQQVLAWIVGSSSSSGGDWTTTERDDL